VRQEDIMNTCTTNIPTVIKRHTCALVVAGALTLTAATASADVIQIYPDATNATEGIGDFSGSLSYAYDGVADLGNLVVTLTNESVVENGGYITGFLFNADSTDPGVTITLNAASHDFYDIAGQSAPPFGGPYDGGAAIGGHWTGGGRPHGGIGVGQTGQFEFTVSAFDASSLTASSFLNDALDPNFVIRFRGFENGGSDKMAAIPTPGAIALLALASFICSRPQRRRTLAVPATA
jgi:hypothetical protein